MRKHRIISTWLAMACLSHGALAAEIILPQGAEPIERIESERAITLPTGPYGQISRPNEVVRGRVIRQSWQIQGSESAAALTDQLIAQYERQGFALTYQCETISCGGYDFRYGIETTPPPEFTVNLEAFDYVDLRSNDEIITILSSALNNRIYIQQIHVQLFEPSNNTAKTASQNPEANSNDSRIILHGVKFASGATSPNAVNKDEMQSIAERLEANPQERCYIVGHSDQTGGLAANLSVTRARAESVRQILINDYAVNPDQLIAEGVAFLAPIDDNNKEIGRQNNRRVEAVFLINQ